MKPVPYANHLNRYFNIYNQKSTAIMYNVLTYVHKYDPASLRPG